ncbi:MAG TPA: aminotransferase class I/II-fold pyridoxal phosphate-dependent enzyme [Thermoanaerobaculaceae bacterium]|nr:aminotransferase class I/II-fold pyridoxal phosphate-dependent enzyme [Thermoanaerobaculaceae bacterium]
MGAPAGYVRDDAAVGALRLDLNEAPREAGSSLRQALVERLTACAFNRYPEIDAHTARRAAAELYRWRVEGTRVGNGSNELLDVVVRALLPRGGALLATPELCRRVDGELLPFGTSWLVQAAFEAALECRAEGVRLVAGLVAERERLRRALATVSRVDVAPSSANFLLLRVVGRTGSELAAELAGRGLAVRRLAELDAAGWVRATVGSPVENDRLVAAIAEVANG